LLLQLGDERQLLGRRGTSDHRVVGEAELLALP
jgi:hypothetical protein